jgi:L-lactate dehydrogenase complex protein LldG
VERDAFLARVAAAARTAQLPAHPDLDPGLLVADLAPVDLVDLFSSRVAEVDGVVHRPASEDDVGALVLEIAMSHDASSFMAWDEAELGVEGVAAHLVAAGLREVSGVVPKDGRLEHQTGYMDLSLGVTGAEAGFAESGTVVVRSGPGRPRMASVVPLVHVVLLGVDRIHRSLTHWMAREGLDVAAAANVVAITGPSKTADIEQNINVGVHGPRHVHLILV